MHLKNEKWTEGGFVPGEFIRAKIVLSSGTKTHAQPGLKGS